MARFYADNEDDLVKSFIMQSKSVDHMYWVNILIFTSLNRDRTDFEHQYPT